MTKIMDDGIEFTGMDALRFDEQERVKVLSERYFPKFKRLVQNLTKLHVHVKVHDATGSARKYSMHVKLTVPGKLFHSDNHADTDISKACHQAFQAIEHQIEHAYK